MPRAVRMRSGSLLHIASQSWDVLLKPTGAELDLLTDIGIHLFVEGGIRLQEKSEGKRPAGAGVWPPQIEH